MEKTPKALYSGICHFKSMWKPFYFHVELIWKNSVHVTDKKKSNKESPACPHSYKQVSTKDSSLYKD